MEDQGNQKLILLFSMLIVCVLVVAYSYDRKNHTDDLVTQEIGGIIVNTDSTNQIIKIEELESDSICEYGGVCLMLGYDKNCNEILEDDEIIQKIVICNGVNGKDGVNGTK